MAPACSSLARASSALTATSSLSSSASSFCRALPLRLCSRAYADCKISHRVYGKAEMSSAAYANNTSASNVMQCIKAFQACSSSRASKPVLQSSDTRPSSPWFFGRAGAGIPKYSVLSLKSLDTDVPVSVLFHKCTNAFAQARHWSQSSANPRFFIRSFRVFLVRHGTSMTRRGYLADSISLKPCTGR